MVGVRARLRSGDLFRLCEAPVATSPDSARCQCSSPASGYRGDSDADAEVFVAVCTVPSGGNCGRWTGTIAPLPLLLTAVNFDSSPESMGEVFWPPLERMSTILGEGRYPIASWRVGRVGVKQKIETKRVDEMIGVKSER